MENFNVLSKKLNARIAQFNPSVPPPNFAPLSSNMNRDNFAPSSRLQGRLGRPSVPDETTDRNEQSNKMTQVEKKKQEHMKKVLAVQNIWPKLIENGLIPQATEEAEEREKAIYMILFIIVCSEERITLDKVFEEYRRVEGQNGHLKTRKELLDFVESRSNLFKLSRNKRIVMNRGFGYKKGMVHLARLVLTRQMSSPDGTVNVTDIFEAAAALPTHSHMTDWTDDFIWSQKLDSNSFVEDFLEDHPAIFEVEVRDFTQVYVKVRDSAKEIPSLWNISVLPTPECHLEKQNNQLLYDFSRIYNVLGEVIHGTGNYLKVRITDGPWTGRNVYVLDNILGTEKNFHLVTAYPVQTMAHMTVHFTLFGKCDFRCMKIQKVKDQNRIEELRFRMGDSMPVDKEDEKETAIIREKKIIDYLDSLFDGEEPRECRDIEELIENTDGQFLTIDLIQFLTAERPHLYRLEGSRICRLSSEKRRLRLKFLKHLAEKSRSQKELASCVKLVDDKGVNISPLKAMEELKPLLQVTVDFKTRAATYGLKGVFVPKENLLIPGSIGENI